jgi:hypothetical protein
MIVRLSKVGLIVCGMYTAYFAVLMGGSYAAGDSASALYAALAMLPAGLFLSLLESILGYSHLPFLPYSWMNSSYFCYPVGLVIAYLFGWAMSAVGRLLVRLDGGRLDRLDERVLDYFDKDV